MDESVLVLLLAGSLLAFAKVNIFMGAKNVGGISVPVYVNVGGAVIPLVCSALILTKLPVELYPAVLITTVATTIITYSVSVVDEGGVKVPVVLPALIAGMASLSMTYPYMLDYMPHIAYLASTIGTIAGADLMKLSESFRVVALLRARGGSSSKVTIGGAGTLDAIIVAGLTAVSYAFLVTKLIGA